MNIKLIAPHEQREDGISSAETFKIQRVSLPLLAALTPTDHTVKIVDEAFASDDVDEDVDLVGITVMTDLALRSYHIADTYRKRGVRVVLGGIHPTVLPTESLEHADSIVIGEAEKVWPQLVSDAAFGKIQKIYRASNMVDLKGMPQPRRDLYPMPISKGYTPISVGIETSRGCPYDCEFCSIGHTMGRQYRVRPVQEVIEEVDSIDARHLFLVDDAIGLNRTLTKKLFTEMIPLRQLWVGQGTVSLAEDLELLRLMKRSGCSGLLIGFESLQKETQDEMKKFKKRKIDFSEVVRRFHDEGIFILGSFVFGFDQENKDVFDQTFEFAITNRLDGIQLRIMVPFPGTRLYARLLKEDRLFMPNWWLHGYSSDTLLFRTKGMSPDEFLEGFARLNRQVYSYGSIIKRFFGMSLWKRTAFGSRIYMGFNLATRKRYLKSLCIPQPFAGPYSN